MPTLAVARGTVKSRGKVFSQGQSIRLVLRDIDSIRDCLAAPDPYCNKNNNGQIRRELRPTESLWKAAVTRMYFYRINALRLAMIDQMGFRWKDVARVPIEELIRMVVKRRGYHQWLTPRSKKWSGSFQRTC